MSFPIRILLWRRQETEGRRERRVRVDKHRGWAEFPRQKTSISARAAKEQRRKRFDISELKNTRQPEAIEI
jgi:hypothetical protein